MTPQNRVIELAAQQDYDSFYQSEVRMRRLRRCPPFADLFVFTVSGTEEGSVLRAAAGARERLRQVFPGEEVLGPAPAPVLKLNNRVRHRLLRLKNSSLWEQPLGSLFRVGTCRAEIAHHRVCGKGRRFCILGGSAAAQQEHTYKQQRRNGFPDTG